MDQLTSADVDVIQKCFARTDFFGGKTHVDDRQHDANGVVDSFRIAAGAQSIGLQRVRGMMEVYKQAANYGNLVNAADVFIKVKSQPQGTVTWKKRQKKQSVESADVALLETATPEALPDDEHVMLQLADGDATEALPAVPAWVAPIVQEMVKMGLTALAAWVKEALTTPKVGWISTNAFYARKGTDMWVTADKADDWAELYHNDQWLGRVLPGQELRQVITDFRDGVNFMVAKVDNNSIPPGMMSLRAKFAQDGKWVPGSAYQWKQDGQLLGGRTWYIVTRYIAR